MSTRRRRIVILLVTLLQLSAITAGLVWRAVQWQQQGWAGVAFLMAADEVTEQVMPLTLLSPGQVFFVVPGSPADEAGMKVGDLMVAVDGVPLAEVERLAELAAERRHGDTVWYELEEGTERREVTVTLGSPFATAVPLLTTATSLVVAIAFLAISLLVFWARPDSRGAFVFYLLCAVAAATFFMMVFVGIDQELARGIQPVGTDLGPYLPWLSFWVLAVLMTNLLLHLSLVFPAERPVLRRQPKVLTWIHSLPFFPFVLFPAVVGILLLATRGGLWIALGAGGLLLAALALLLVRSARRLGAVEALRRRPFLAQGVALAAMILPVPFLKLGGKAVAGLAAGLLMVALLLASLVLLTVYSLATCVALYRSYRESGMEVKRQVRWPLWGTLVALLAILVLSFLNILWSHLDPASFNAQPWIALGFNELFKLCYLVIALSFAFGILRYRLLDIDVLLKKTVVYGALTGLVVVLYFGLVGLLGLVFVAFTEVEDQTVTVVATLAIAALFVPLRNRVQRFVDRRFFRREEGEREAEMAQAFEIQRALLPTEVPQGEGLELAASWQPARVVSGDYYDVLRLADGRLALCIGDVAGKGMPAALLMSSVQAAVKAVVPTGRPPAEVVAQVRQVVCQNLSGGKFLTFFFALVDPVGRRLTYTNAGHLPPILRRADGEVLRLEEGGGVMGRLFADTPLGQGEVELRTGDRLVLFTDGVTEARDLRGDELGDERLLELVSAHAGLGAAALQERIAAAVRRFAGEPLQDDLTLLVMAVGEPRAESPESSHPSAA